MNHLIISAALFAASVLFAYVFDRQTKTWQSENKEAVAEAKELYGSKYSAYSKSHFAYMRAIFSSIIGSFIYLSIALLIFFFGN